jgi:hypothetical protein
VKVARNIQPAQITKVNEAWKKRTSAFIGQTCSNIQSEGLAGVKELGKEIPGHVVQLGL